MATVLIIPGAGVVELPEVEGYDLIVPGAGVVANDYVAALSINVADCVSPVIQVGN